MLLVGGGFRCKAVIFRQNRKPAKKRGRKCIGPLLFNQDMRACDDKLLCVSANACSQVKTCSVTRQKRSAN